MDSTIYNLIENDFEARFALKQIPPSKVAEISKATAESGCLAEERIDLHIGNPVQDPRLDELYTRLVFGNTLKNFDELSWSEQQPKILETFSNPVRPKMAQLLFKTIEKANPYMPLGGFNPQKPGTLVRQIHAWLTVGQDEPLDYAIGESGSAPEIAITSGGKVETLKLLLQVIEEYLKGLDKNIISLEESLSPATTRAYHGKIYTIQGTENELWQQLNRLVENPSHHIGFILIHKIYSKECRRK
ncbi:MAG: hypothetical protein ONB05_01220, partial [candidate division KSB1 bacterium]|nr:hypothetical protein [candidate division KSB1 bacterium]